MSDGKQKKSLKLKYFIAAWMHKHKSCSGANLAAVKADHKAYVEGRPIPRFVADYQAYQRQRNERMQRLAGRRKKRFLKELHRPMLVEAFI